MGVHHRCGRMRRPGETQRQADRGENRVVQQHPISAHNHDPDDHLGRGCPSAAVRRTGRGPPAHHQHDPGGGHATISIRLSHFVCSTPGLVGRSTAPGSRGRCPGFPRSTSRRSTSSSRGRAAPAAPCGSTARRFQRDHPHVGSGFPRRRGSGRPARSRSNRRWRSSPRRTRSAAGEWSAAGAASSATVNALVVAPLTTVNRYSGDRALRSTPAANADRFTGIPCGPLPERGASSEACRNQVMVCRR